MPSTYQIGLPIPKDYSEFENMVKEFFCNKYGCVFQKYGRPGQKQSGIDLICGTIGVQCKNYYNTQLTIPLLRKELEKCKKDYAMPNRILYCNYGKKRCSYSGLC